MLLAGVVSFSKHDLSGEHPSVLTHKSISLLEGGKHKRVICLALLSLPDPHKGNHVPLPVFWK